VYSCTSVGMPFKVYLNLQFIFQLLLLLVWSQMQLLLLLLLFLISIWTRICFLFPFYTSCNKDCFYSFFKTMVVGTRFKNIYISHGKNFVIEMTHLGKLNALIFQMLQICSYSRIPKLYKNLPVLCCCQMIF
jgi:hypothetical protein